jgi:hypothetical protein
MRMFSLGHSATATWWESVCVFRPLLGHESFFSGIFDVLNDATDNILVHR